MLLQIYFGIGIFVVWIKVMVYVYMKVKLHVRIKYTWTYIVELITALLIWPFNVAAIIHVLIHSKYYIPTIINLFEEES